MWWAQNALRRVRARTIGGACFGLIFTSAFYTFIREMSRNTEAKLGLRALAARFTAPKGRMLRVGMDCTFQAFALGDQDVLRTALWEMLSRA